MPLNKIARSLKFDEVAICGDDKTEVDIIKERIASRKQEDAFYILDVADVIVKHKTWVSTLPRVEPFYAVKCIPHPTIVKMLASLNAGFHCASKREIQMVTDFGVPADRIIFANTVKPNSHIKFARECGVKLLTVDSEFELEKIKNIYPEAQVVIRFRCDANMVVRVLGEKFGCEPEIESRTLIRKAKDLGLNVHGFSFHVGTECQEPDTYNRGIKIAEKLIEFAKSVGLQNVRLIDIGGGFSGLRDNSMDKPTKADTNPSSFWASICDSLDCIIHDCQYPESSPGDWIMWSNMGSYTLSAAGKFNAFHPPIAFPCIERRQWDAFRTENETIQNFEFVPDFKEVEILEDERTDFEHARDIIENRNQEDAFYILDVGDVIEKHGIWQSQLPRVVPHFAVKCNPDQTVIKVLAALNSSFDCASKHEIEQVQACGVSGDRIIFAHPIKPESHIRFAKKVGVDKITADCELELHKIKNIFPEARIIIRFRCDALVSATELGSKFGCETDAEGPKLIKIAKDLGLNIHGFSFHVGSLCGEFEAFSRGIKIALRLIEYAKSLGFRDVKLIDIGGGFPGEKGHSLDKFARTINDVLKGVDSSIKIVSEPGRFYVASAFTLLTMVHGKKIVHEKNTKRYMYYTNDGCYGSFVDTLLKVTMRFPIPLNTPADSKKHPSTFWGPTADSLDCLISDCPYPEINISDWLVWEDMGAYTRSLAGTFNGFQPSVVLPFARKKEWNLFKDLWAHQEKSMSNGIKDTIHASNLCDRANSRS